MPVTGELSQQNIKDRYYGVNDPVAMKLLNKAGEMSTLEPPDDESIKTLYVGGLDARITEQDLRDNFYAHGEIESVRIVLQRACAFVTYTTREAAEKAADELSNKLVIKGLRLKLMWGRPQQPKPEIDGSDQAKQQAAVAHSGMLPRAVLSQQQSQLHPPGTHDLMAPPPPMAYFNIPPPPSQQERALYPSMDPQRMGALIPSHDGGSSSGPSGSGEVKSGSEKQAHVHQPYGYHPGMPPTPPPGGYQQPFYPPYGYMGGPPPPHHPQYQHYPPGQFGHQQGMAPPTDQQRPPPSTNQQHQQAASSSGAQSQQ